MDQKDLISPAAPEKRASAAPESASAPSEPLVPAASQAIAPEEAEPKTEEEKKKDYKKKAVKAGVAVVTSASVLMGGLFSSPDALLAQEQNLNPAAITQNDSDSDQDGDEDEESSEEEEELSGESAGLRAALRQRILRLPLAVRVFVLVPLWAIGWAVWTVAGGLWTMLLGPIAGKAVSWLFLLAALLGAAALGLKAVFPDMPLKKIFNKKSLLGLILGGLGLGIADLTVPLFWDGYETLAAVLRASGMALILGIVSFALIRRALKKRQEELQPAEGPAEPASHDWTREEILALADTVSRKR